MDNEADKIKYENNELVEHYLKTSYILVVGKDENDLRNLLEDLKGYIVELGNNSEIDIKHNFNGFKTYTTVKEGYTSILSNYWQQEKIYIACVRSVDNCINGTYEKITQKDLIKKGFTKWRFVIDTNYKENNNIMLNEKKGKK